MNVQSIFRGTALASSVVLALTIAACGAGTDTASDGVAADSSQTSSSVAAGNDSDGGTSRAPGSAAATSQPETAMPDADDAGPHNNADVDFNHSVISHNQQAATMVGLIDGRTDNADIIDLGRRIATSQGREIEHTSARLAAWGDDATAQSGHGDRDGHEARSGHGGRDEHADRNGHGERDGHGSHSASPTDTAGMLSDDSMQKLAAAKGAEFDRLFLEGMIAHHESSVDMAEDIIRNGENAATRKTAEAIVKDRKPEIEEMKKLLDD